MKIIKFEKINENNKEGFIIKGTFASTKNKNGVYFNSVATFLNKKPPTDLNINHNRDGIDYSTNTTIEIDTDSIKTDNNLLKFTWQMKTVNENLVDVLNTKKIIGFSPELEALEEPVLGKTIGKNSLGEDVRQQFFTDEGLQWIATAVLTSDKEPGFIGADDAKVEKLLFESVIVNENKEEGKKDDTKTNENVSNEKLVKFENKIKALEDENIELKANIQKLEQNIEDKIKKINFSSIENTGKQEAVHATTDAEKATIIHNIF